MPIEGTLKSNSLRIDFVKKNEIKTEGHNSKEPVFVLLNLLWPVCS